VRLNVSWESRSRSRLERAERTAPPTRPHSYPQGPILLLYHQNMFCHSGWKLLGFLSAAVLLANATKAETIAERGKYLVMEVAKCGDCHTPIGEKGEPDAVRWLKGGPLSFQPLQPVPKWEKAAPDLTSSGSVLRGWGEQRLVRFLQTGLGPRGSHADPPMPAYRLRAEDAQAIVAYLKTLK
jgi:mono/diheme cytochrome c family protein